MPRTTATELDRVESVEFARSRRLGSHITVLVLRPDGLDGSTRRRRAAASLTELATFLRQRLRSYDGVIEDGPGGRVIVVATEVDALGARSLQRRLGGRLRQEGRTVQVGVATFPEDGTLLTHLLEHAGERLAARRATDGVSRDGTGTTADGTGPAAAAGW